MARSTNTGRLVADESDLSGSEAGPVVPVSNVLSTPVLVLNLNYVPVNVCTARRAIVLVGKGKAELLENHSGEVHTVTAVFDVPSIIRLVYLVRRPYAPRKLSNKEIFLRDQYTCQYCQKKTQELTLDHVIPRRQHGPNTWENVVAACPRCNLHKAGRTPAEANMKLIREPKAPQPNPYRMLQNYTMQEQWLPYVPWTIRG